MCLENFSILPKLLQIAQQIVSAVLFKYEMLRQRQIFAMAGNSDGSPFNAL